MNLYHPSRRRLLNGRPCWQDSLIVIPHLELLPSETMPGEWIVQLMFGDFGHYDRVAKPEGMLPELLKEWASGPEDFVLKHFPWRKPPIGGGTLARKVESVPDRQVATISGKSLGL